MVTSNVNRQSFRGALFFLNDSRFVLSRQLKLTTTSVYWRLGLLLPGILETSDAGVAHFHFKYQCRVCFSRL